MKKIFCVLMILTVAVAGVFAVTVDSALSVANSVIKYAGVEITGWDGVIALAVVLFVEVVIKNICKLFKTTDSAWTVIVRLAPIVVSIAVYFVIALVQKTSVPTGLIHGLGIGLVASGSYSSLFNLAKKAIKGDVESANEEAKAILNSSNDKTEKAETTETTETSENN